jgi:hypothetical protein
MLSFAFHATYSKTHKTRVRGTIASIVKGWRNWNIGQPSLLQHFGSEAHKASEEKYIGFMNPCIN